MFKLKLIGLVWFLICIFEFVSPWLQAKCVKYILNNLFYSLKQHPLYLQESIKTRFRDSADFFFILHNYRPLRQYRKNIPTNKCIFKTACR